MRISDWSSDVCSSDLIHPSTKTVTRKPRRCARRGFFCLPASFFAKDGYHPYQGHDDRGYRCKDDQVPETDAEHGLSILRFTARGLHPRLPDRALHTLAHRIAHSVRLPPARSLRHTLLPPPALLQTRRAHAGDRWG